MEMRPLSETWTLPLKTTAFSIASIEAGNGFSSVQLLVDFSCWLIEAAAVRAGHQEEGMTRYQPTNGSENFCINVQDYNFLFYGSLCLF